jgi:hypothetical protein
LFKLSYVSEHDLGVGAAWPLSEALLSLASSFLEPPSIRPAEDAIDALAFLKLLLVLALELVVPVIHPPTPCY